MTNRELDALVAKKVMGWQWEDDRLTIEGHWKTKEDEYISSFSPSTDIAAAFEITKKICNTWVMFYHDAYTQWHVSCDHQRRTAEDCRFEGWADELPEAICLAALKAVGIDTTGPQPVAPNDK